MNATSIKKLANEILVGDETVGTSRIYILEKLKTRPTAETVRRIGGKPIGISSEQYPMFNGKPMEHLVTLDLEVMPELKIGELADKSAVALFISNKQSNNANEVSRGNGEAKVFLLSSEDLQRGELLEVPNPQKLPDDFNDGNPNELDETESYTYEVATVDVPEAVFDDWENNESLEELFEAVHNSAYADGKPTWLQGEGYEGHFIFQFDAKLIEVNLGDSGVMFVFTNTAFWQCC